MPKEIWVVVDCEEELVSAHGTYEGACVACEVLEMDSDCEYLVQKLPYFNE